MGYLDGFESFISSEKLGEGEGEEDDDGENNEINENKKSNTISDYYLKENGNLNKKSEKYYIEDLYKSIQEFSEQNKLDIHNLLTHPKPRCIKQMLKRVDNLDRIEKSLIFVRRVSSIEEIEKQLISNFDDEIQTLVYEINNKIKGFKTLEKQIDSIIKKEDKSGYEDETEDEDENYLQKQKKEDENNETIKSKWLENLESCKVKGKETSNFNKMKIKFQSGLDNKYYDFFEPKVLETFFKTEEIEKIYLQNKEKINSYILSYNANLKEKKMRRYHKIRAFTAGFLEYMSEVEKKYKELCNVYVNTMNLKKLDEDKQLMVDIKDINKFYIDFQKQKNFWDIDEFDKNVLNQQNKNLDLKLFTDQLNMKKIIEKNILNGEGMIYLLAIISKINQKHKFKEINTEYIINIINKDRSVFHKRIINRISDFIKNYNQEEKRMKNLKIDKSYFKSPIAGASGGTSQTKRITIQNLFNTSFYPDILISTDIFNEGIDLHLFCSRIINYGIAWLPGEMEQRIGRIDRLFCKAYRNYEDSKQEIDGGNAKQVKVDFIHMDDEMDKRQISKILERMIESIKELELPKDMEESKKVDCKEEKNEISEKIEILNNIGERMRV